MDKLAVQTAPSPNDSAASNTFCAAAEQSSCQALLDFAVSPQTIIACLVSFNIRQEESVSHCIQNVPVCYDDKFHGRRSLEEGAAIPARTSVSSFSFSTGRSVYLRTLYGLKIVSNVSLTSLLSLDSVLLLQAIKADNNTIKEYFHFILQTYEVV